MVGVNAPSVKRFREFLRPLNQTESANSLDTFFPDRQS
jgi:hypothetical protein